MNSIVLGAAVDAPARRAALRRRRLVVTLALAALALGGLGLVVGSEGWSWKAWRADLGSAQRLVLRHSASNLTR